MEEVLRHYDDDTLTLTPWEGDNSRQRERIEVSGLIAEIKKATGMTNRGLGVRWGSRVTGRPEIPGLVFQVSPQGF